MMLNKSTSPYPILWAELRKFLTGRHVQLHVHHRHRAMYTVANTIYLKESDNLTTIELGKIILIGIVYQEGTTVSNTVTGHDRTSRSNTGRGH